MNRSQRQSLWIVAVSLAVVACEAPVSEGVVVDSRPDVTQADVFANGSDDIGPCDDPNCDDGACASSIWNEALPDATLPGESTECQSWGAVACRASIYYGYICHDETGAPTNSIGSANELGCSQAQVDAWVKAYDATPCRWLVPWQTLANLPLLNLLDPAVAPQVACCDLGRKTCRFRIGCVAYVHDRQNVGEAGGNASGTHWKLTITPPTTAAMKPGLPFVACASHLCGPEATEAGHGGNGLRVLRDDNRLLLGFSEVGMPSYSPASFQETLASCAQSFKKCNGWAD